MEKDIIGLETVKTLYNVSEAIGGEIGQESLLHLILKSALHQTNSCRGSIMLCDGEGKYLTIAVGVGLDKDIIKETRLRVGDRIAGWVAKRAQPVKVDNIDEHPVFRKFSLHHPDKSFLCIPIIRKRGSLHFSGQKRKEILGVITISRKLDGKVFTEGEFIFVNLLASQTAISLENALLISSLHDAYLSTIQSLVLLLEAKDPFTRGHSQRVTYFCKRLAQKMLLKEQEGDVLIQAANLHDIGKIGISETVLNKVEKLSDADWYTIKRHPVIGEEVLRPIKFFDEIRQIVRHHHERYDGKGYPDGLKGEELSLPEKIIIVADAFDAMNSTRAYREPLTKERIARELINNREVQFDPVVINTFLDMVDFR